MRPTKSRFVTVCQQALIVATALAVLGPAADVISLDVVTRPGAAAQTGDARAPQAPAGGSATDAARVETAPVDPKVTDVPLDEPADTTAAEVAAEAEEHGHAHESVPTDGDVVQTAPQEVKGYGAVGVTWQAGTEIAEDDIVVQARTRDNGAWSEWADIHYTQEEGPDAGSADARNARPGTDPLIVGDVEQVQTRVVTAAGVEAPDLEMAVVDPGASTGTEVQAPQLAGTAGAQETELATDEGQIALQSGTVSRPTIYSRAQWGADESWRKGSVSYGKIAAGFIHHTVNTNDYTADQVPGMLRSIYAYHTKTRGWNDIGYNFVIDRFGRIWEGRYGGVDKAVVGAHTEGYNSYSFAASALGNFEEVQPAAVMLDAYARLYAWKLSLSGIAADDTSQYVGSKYFQAINGHRDAGQTACPGRYLYAQIPAVRTAARKYQLDGTPATEPTASPTPTSPTTYTPRTGYARVPDLAGSTYPDLVARRASDGAGVVLRTAGLLSFGAQTVTSTGWSKYDIKVLSPDLTGDGRSDMFVRIGSTGTAGVRPGLGDGTFGSALVPTKTFIGYDRIAAVGRFDGDAYGDLMGRSVATGNLVLFRGNGAGGFSKTAVKAGFAKVSKLVATGDITGDGRADLLARFPDGTFNRYNGDGKGGIGAPTVIPGTWDHPVLSGFGDMTGDKFADLLVRASNGSTYIAPGTGTGTFSKLVPASGSLADLGAVSAAPLVGSAHADAIGFSGDSFVLVAHTGKINIATPISTGVSFRGANLILNVDDWNGDGTSDVVTRSAANGSLTLYKGTGEGRLAAGTVIDARNFNGLGLLATVGDLTGDKKPDLVGTKDGGLWLYPGNGAAALGKAQSVKPSLSGDALLGLGRWDGDTTLDIAVRHGAGFQWLAGGTSAPKALAGDVSGLTGVIAAGDVTGDGRTDLIGRSSAGQLWMLPAGTTGFGTRRYLGDGFGGYDLVG